jgi:hypothetical protein
MFGLLVYDTFGLILLQVVYYVPPSKGTLDMGKLYYMVINFVGIYEEDFWNPITENS